MANHLKMATIDSILLLHERGWSSRRIARHLGIHRDTVSRSLKQSKQARALIGSAESKLGQALIGSDDFKLGQALIGSEDPVMPSLAPVTAASDDARRRPQTSLCEPFRAFISGKLELGLTAQRIYQDLVVEHHFTGKYHSVRRFVGRLQGTNKPLPFRRLECGPGEEAQVDFGTVLCIHQLDGRRRRSHVFRIVLSHSRKGYSEAVYRQTTDAFLFCLENAFGHFGGVPATLVLDNLKAAVAKADWFDPELQPKVRAFAEHYGVAFLPTRPYTPRHKGKIENGIAYVKDNALKGHTFASLEEQNQHLLAWESTTADTRIHGTIRQQVGKLFREVELPALRPLPKERFPFFHEGRRIAHRDGHVEIARAFYSVPPEYVGRQVWVRWDGRLVRIFNERMEPITVHAQHERGRFSTQGQHIASEKISSVERGAAWMLGRIQLLGPNAARWGEGVITTRQVEGIRVLQGLLSLANKHAIADLEQACAVAVSYGCYRLRTIRTLLQRQAPKQESFLDEHPLIRGLKDYQELVHSSFQKGD
jgi:transposase